MIDTMEKRRSVLDFGKYCGSGMPVPTGTIGEAARGHILNLYSGILPPLQAFFFWRNKGIQTTNWHGRAVPTTAWRTAGGAPDVGFTPGVSIKDS